VTDLLITGGTVVTAARSLRADVAVSGGVITSVEPDLSGLAATAREVVDASGLLVLPGAVDAHTHTRSASDAEPDRFFQDSVAAAFGGTTTFLVFNTPASGEEPGAPRSLRDDLARRGPQRAAGFTWEATARGVDAVVARAVSP
jgi:dihydroorotase-like cyclic amidohydrolase